MTSYATYKRTTEKEKKEMKSFNTRPLDYLIQYTVCEMTEINVLC